MSKFDIFMAELYALGWRGRLLWWTIIAGSALVAFALLWGFAIVVLGIAELQR